MRFTFLAKNTIQRVAGVLGYTIAKRVDASQIIKRYDLETVYDIGANEGQYALSILGQSPNIKVFSFEPHPAAFESLSRLTVRYPTHKALNYAVGSTTGKMKFHIASQTTASSFLKPSAQLRADFPHIRPDTCISVEITTIQNIVETCVPSGKCLLKIDTQGYEMEVLKGAEPVLSSFDYVYLEVSFVSLYEHSPLFEEVFLWLKARDFYLLEVGDLVRSRTTGAVVQADCLFAKHMAA